MKPTSVAVRPPTPSTLQVTARNTSAATSRQPAPSASRILGTDAEERPRRGGASLDRAGNGAGSNGAATGAGVGAATRAAAAAVGTDAARNVARRPSARVSVWKSRLATSPRSDNAHAGQDGSAEVIEAPQSGQRCGSA